MGLVFKPLCSSHRIALCCKSYSLYIQHGSSTNWKVSCYADNSDRYKNLLRLAFVYNPHCCAIWHCCASAI